MPKLQIEESAARRQAAIDRGEEVIVGVNKYQSQEPDHVDILDVDNDAVRRTQIARLDRVMKIRDPEKCRAALAALTEAARSGNGNLLALSIEASRARATVGEISDALEAVFTRHRAASQAAAHKTLVPALVEALKREGAGDILVVCGGVIPPRDYDFLKKAGVSAIFGPGTKIPLAAAEILSLIRQQRLAA